MSSNPDVGTAYGLPQPSHHHELTEVRPGTPMGELLRRYWLPAGRDWCIGSGNQVVCIESTEHEHGVPSRDTPSAHNPELRSQPYPVLARGGVAPRINVLTYSTPRTLPLRKRFVNRSQKRSALRLELTCANNLTKARASDTERTDAPSARTSSSVKSTRAS